MFGSHSEEFNRKFSPSPNPKFIITAYIASVISHLWTVKGYFTTDTMTKAVHFDLTLKVTSHVVADRMWADLHKLLGPVLQASTVT